MISAHDVLSRVSFDLQTGDSWTTYRVRWNRESWQFGMLRKNELYKFSGQHLVWWRRDGFIPVTAYVHKCCFRLLSKKVLGDGSEAVRG